MRYTRAAILWLGAAVLVQAALAQTQAYEYSSGPAFQWNSDAPTPGFGGTGFARAWSERETWLVFEPMSIHVVPRYGVQASIYTTYHCGGEVEVNLQVKPFEGQPAFLMYTVLQGQNREQVIAACSLPRNAHGSHRAEYGWLYFFSENRSAVSQRIVMYFQKERDF